MELRSQSQRIAHAIKASGIKQIDLAAYAKVSRSAASQWASGDIIKVTAENIFAIADMTGYEARWLATGEGPEKPDAGGKAKKLLDLYRQLDERGQAAVFRVAQSESAFSIDGECDDCEHCQRKSA